MEALQPGVAAKSVIKFISGFFSGSVDEQSDCFGSHTACVINLFYVHCHFTS